MKYSKEQIECLRQYYPDSNYDEIFRLFPQKTKKQIKAIAHYYGIKSNNPGHAYNLSGQRFGRLVALRINHKENGKTYWDCQCDCGNTSVTSSQCLLNGKTKSCGCLARDSKHTQTAKNHCGKRFGKLIAMERYPKYKGNRTYYLCKCDCGCETIVSGSSLVTGKTLSCGCVSKRIDFWTLKHEDISDNRKYIVYKHTAPNGKAYIGITKQSTAKRWQNGLGYATQQLFWRAIQKYGWDSFDHEVLEENLEIADAFEREKQYIEEYKTYDKRYGYNVHMGGTSGRTLVVPVMQCWHGKPVNFFESITAAARELNVTSGTIRNYIEASNLPDEYSFVKMPEIHTYDITDELYSIRDEYHYRITQLTKTEKRNKTIERNKKSTKRINQYSTDGKYIKTWDSIADAKRTYPKLGSINTVLQSKGNSKTAGGFQWRYDDGNHSDIEPAKVTMGRKPVVQIDCKTGRIIHEYVSAIDAEHKTGIKHTQISKCCYQRIKTAGGFIWKHKD